ncbi:MAG: helix-turn-helix transcriptional regulator [Campylobacter sp.]|nr:helix-turn-helix transcriptional regulator [Campylobacter sp.]
METYEKIKAMRVEAKLSRKALADISGFNERTILAFETDERQPSYKYLQFCALYFGYEPESIQDNAKELEKMSENEQVLRIYKDLNSLNIVDFAELVFFENTLDEKKSAEFLEVMLHTARIDIQLKDAIKRLNINTNDYTPSKYAEFIKLQSIMGKLEKSKQYSKQDLELLALFSSLDAEVKDSLKALIKSIIAKGGKM